MRSQIRNQTTALNNLQLPQQTCSYIFGNQVQSGSATASVLCLCMPCTVGILPPTAGSCSTSPHQYSCTPMLCMVHISCSPTYPVAVPALHRLVSLSRLELHAAIRWPADTQSGWSLTGLPLWVSAERSPPLECICSASLKHQLTSQLDHGQVSEAYVLALPFFGLGLYEVI